MFFYTKVVKNTNLNNPTTKRNYSKPYCLYSSTLSNKVCNPNFKAPCSLILL